MSTMDGLSCEPVSRRTGEHHSERRPLTKGTMDDAMQLLSTEVTKTVRVTFDRTDPETAMHDLILKMQEKAFVPLYDPSVHPLFHSQTRDILRMGKHERKILILDVRITQSRFEDEDGLQLTDVKFSFVKHPAPQWFFVRNRGEVTTSGLSRYLRHILLQTFPPEVITDEFLSEYVSSLQQQAGRVATKENFGINVHREHGGAGKHALKTRNLETSIKSQFEIPLPGTGFVAAIMKSEYSEQKQCWDIRLASLKNIGLLDQDMLNDQVMGAEAKQGLMRAMESLG